MKPKLKLLGMLIITIAYHFISTSIFSQGVAINTTGAAADISAMLDVTSTNAGMLIPRMTLAQRNAIATPATSLLVYQTDGTPGYYYYNGTAWVSLFSNNTGWSLTGNAGTSVGTNFLGTTDANDFAIYTNNAERIRVSSGGNVGIGTTGPGAALDIANGSQPSMIVGADLDASTRTNATLKVANLAMYHYTNAEEPFALIRSLALSGENRISIGGEGTSLNAATTIKFLTAANTTTIEGTERMRITSEGNVGIGTTSPVTKLEVVGTGENTNAERLSIEGKHVTTGNPFASLQFRDGYASGGSKMAASILGIYESTTIWDDIGLQFNTANGGGSVNAMRITKNGYVGIGTTSPASLNGRQYVLQIGNNTGSAGLVLAHNGTGTTDSWELLTSGGADFGNFSVFRNTTEYLAMTRTGNIYMAHNGGNVGIGSTGLEDKLNIRGAVNAGHGVVDNNVIATARPKAAYMVIVSMNYSTGNNVRSAIYHVLLNNEGTAVTNVNTISTYNGQTATFSVSGGNLIISGIPAGNNQVAVFGNQL